MPITDKQWKLIELLISMPLGSVKLKCDNYIVNAVVKPLNDGKPRRGIHLVVAIFVDGEMKGSWAEQDDERCKKFWRKKIRHLLEPNLRKKALLASEDRSLPREERKFYKENAEKTFEVWQPYWETPGAFCRHIRKTCNEIELMENV